MSTLKTFSAAVLLIALAVPARGQEVEEVIRLNQVGFYPNAPKGAVVVGEAEGPFYITTPMLTDTVFTGTLGARRYAERSAEYTHIADFSAFDTQGTYVVAVPGLGPSHPFVVERDVHDALLRAALKGFYYQRASTALPPAYAGKWSRRAGHPDDHVRVHPSAATEARPAGTVIAAPKGWYDAGDYNKYVVNSGISTATLLSLYEDFPEYMASIDTGIPESENALPDVLDEVLWNLHWLLAMQDPYDGGVYHKLTAADFAGMVLPAEAQAPRYVVQKSTAATLDFAAVTAQASRIFRDLEAARPGLADSLLTAALEAWEWARRHPGVVYDQDEMNRRYDPDVTTGAYGDRRLRDEFIWATTELYVTTHADSFYTAVDLFPDDRIPIPSWSQVRTLGYHTLLRRRSELTRLAEEDVQQLVQRLIDRADTLVEDAAGSAYHVVMGHEEQDFVWGSNSVAANQGILLVQAYRLADDPTYLRYALANLDYLLGRNATGYSFVTGYGDKTPMHPHHRPSEADGVPDPVPGLLVGGPNPGQQDGCTYPSDAPAESYVDDVCSYASNEIAINWNAPLVYLAAALEALHYEARFSIN